MKTKTAIHTYVLEGRVEVSDIAEQIFQDTGIRLILEKEGQEVNGYINAYYKQEEGKEFTVVDVFYYDDDTDMEADEKVHGFKHKLKRIFLTKKKTDKMKETIGRKHQFAKQDIANAIINKLGTNIISNNDEIQD